MDLLKAAVLGLVEGITEFIPVSSTGHLIIAGDWLGFVGERAKTFEIFIQLGAVLSVVWLYRDRLLGTVRESRRAGPGRDLIANLAVAFLPAALVGVLAHDWIKRALFNHLTVAVALILGGLVILVVERWAPTSRVVDVAAIPRRTALGVGLAQVLSLFPGVSRSGATILGGYCLGLSRTAATEFSFFLAIPIMFAATLFDLLKSRNMLVLGDVPLFAIGFGVSFFSALIIVKSFLSYVSRHDFTAFAWYRIVFGILLLASHGRAL